MLLFWWVTLGACRQMTRIQAFFFFNTIEMKAPSEGCGEKSCFASFSLYFPRRDHHAEAWAVGLLLSTSLPDGYQHTKYTLCNLSTPYMGSLWFPKAVSPIPPLSEGCSDVYLSWKVPLFSRLPPPKLKEITTKHLLLSLYTTLRITQLVSCLKGMDTSSQSGEISWLFFLRHFPSPSFEPVITNLPWEVKLSPQPSRVRQLR